MLGRAFRTDHFGCARVAVAAWLLALMFPALARSDGEDLDWFEEPYFVTVADETLIPEGNVSVLAESSEGFLWVGTQRGLLRYDGYRFRNYRHRSEDTRGLPGNEIRDLLVVPDGSLWVGISNAGIAIRRPGRGGFERLRHDPADAASLPSDNVLVLESDGQGGVFVGTYGGGLAHWRAPGRGFVRYPLADLDQGPNWVRSLKLDRQGVLWVGTGDGLFRLAPGDDELRSMPSLPGAAASLAGVYVYSLCETSNGSLWIGSRNHGLFELDASRQRLRTLAAGDPRSGAASHPWINGCVQIGDELWVATHGGGLDVYDPAARRLLRRIRHEPNWRGGLASDRVMRPLLDRQGRVWVGHWGAGLQVASAGSRALATLGVRPGHPASLSHAEVYSLLESHDGEVWIGTGNRGIDVVTADRRRVFSLALRRQLPEALAGDAIKAMARTADGSIWLAPEQAGLWRWTAASGFEPMPALQGERIWQLQAANDGQLWFGADFGIAKLDPSTGDFQRVRFAGDSPQGRNIYSIEEDREGRTYFGSVTGLGVLDASVGMIAAVELRLLGSEGMPVTGSVYHTLFDRQQQLWVTTSSGLFRAAPRGNDMLSLALAPAFPAASFLDESSGVLDDDQGRLWSASGVFEPSIAPRQHLRIEGADIGPGRRNTQLRSREGWLWFGGRRGLLVIDPSRYQPARPQPAVVLSELRVDGLARDLEPGGTLRLAADDRSLALEFVAIDLAAAQSLSYAYRLEGYDRDWHTADPNSRQLSYSNLWPGRYQLRVRARRELGEWSPHELTVAVQVAGQFWQRDWFLLLMALGTAALLALAMRYRTDQLRRQAERLHQLVAQRTVELQSANTSLQLGHAAMQSAHQELAGAHQRLLDTQQQLVLQEKMASLGSLTAGVAHEINNPTNFADGAVQQLEVELQRLQQFLRELAGDEAPAEVLTAFAERFQRLQAMTQTAREGHERIKAIVRDLRQFSRLDEAERKRIHISEPIRSTVNLIRTRFDRISFVLDLAIDPEIDCQPAKLGQAFMNLIVNACEAASEHHGAVGGSVRVVSFIDGAALIIDVVDNGAGMDAATQARIFDPFFTTKGIGAGTGLGLPITLGIIREHGGEISVESSPGHGSRFRLRLPLPDTARAQR